MITTVMIASYVHALTIDDAIFFGNGRTDGRTDKAILGVGYRKQNTKYDGVPSGIFVPKKLNSSLLAECCIVTLTGGLTLATTSEVSQCILTTLHFDHIAF